MRAVRPRHIRRRRKRRCMITSLLVEELPDAFVDVHKLTETSDQEKLWASVAGLVPYYQG